jgi:hypothetical protein
MHHQDPLMELETSIHRLGQRLARIERLLGRTNLLTSEPRTEKKERYEQNPGLNLEHLER